MKLATYRDGSRDGQLVVVSRDLRQAHYASGIAGRLQQVLDDWNFMSPQLEELSQALHHGKARHAFAFEPAKCMAPLPRAYRWVVASPVGDPAAPPATPRRLGPGLPPGADAAPRMSQRGSDELLGACDAIACAGQGEGEDDGIDVEPQVAVVTGDVALGTAPNVALDSVRLLLLANDLRLRGLASAEFANGFGVLQGQPATAFGPVAATPDELGAAWHGGRVHLALQIASNGERLEGGLEGAGTPFHFGELIAHLARTRSVRAGSIVGGGAARAVPLRFGDRIRVDMVGADGASVFGAIDQRVRPPARPERP